MHRLIPAALLAALLLAACGPDLPDRPDAYVAPDSSSQGVSAPAADEEPVPDEPPGDDLPGDELGLNSHLVEILSQPQIDDRVAERFAALGITARAEGAAMRGETAFTFTLVLERDGVQTGIPLAGNCSFFRNDDGGYRGNLTAAWGGVTLLPDDTVAVVGQREIHFLNPGSLAHTGLSLELEDIGGGEFYLSGVGYHPALGYFVPYYRDGEDHIAYFGEDGALQRAVRVAYPAENEYSRLFGQRGVIGDAGRRVAGFVPVMQVVELGASPCLLMPMGGSSVWDGETVQYNWYVYALLDTGTHRAGDLWLTFRAQGDGRTVELFAIGDAGLVEGDADHTHLALYCEEGALRHPLTMDGRDMHACFGDEDLFYERVPGYTGLVYTWGDGPRLEAHCDQTDLTVTLDFAAGTGALAYKIQAAHLSGEPIAVSADGRYELYRASDINVADAFSCTIVLRDTATGALRFLDRAGGMYGGYGNHGFF